MKSKLVVVIVLLFFVFQESEAQDVKTKTLIGNVKDANKKPVVGAYVFLDTIKTDVVTNSRGYFQVEVPKNVKKVYVLSEEHGILGADYMGDKALSFKYLNNNTVTDLENELIDMGYGKVLKKNSTNNVSKIDYGKEVGNSVFTDIYAMIKSRVPGVRVVGSQIIIRGLKSMNTGSDPLFVVNGSVVSSIDHIPPSEVKSISVLKDASSSIYGSNGANGAILIELK